MDPGEDVSPTKSFIANNDIESPSSFQSFGEDKMSSPKYVKWDFDLPPVSEQIQLEVRKIGRELNEHHYMRKKMTKMSPYNNSQRSSRRNIEITPSRHSSLLRSVNLLKEAIGEVPDYGGCSPTQTNPAMDMKTPEKNRDSNSENKDSDKQELSPDVFDDSLNDFLNECSQKVENHFYDGKPHSSSQSSSEKNSNDYKSNCSSDKEKGEKAFRDLTQELDEVDDHLFLEIDLNMYK